MKGHTALVTGGAVRIGAAICEALAAQGCGVVIHYRKSVKEADLLAERLKKKGVKTWTLQAELDTEKDCYELMQKAFSHCGGVDFLVNSAAIFHRVSLADCTQESLIRELQINLLAPIFLVRELADRAQKGKIVNLVDRRVGGVETGNVPYQLSKSALASFTRIAALELAPRFTVNAVAPGAILPPSSGVSDAAREPAGPAPLKHHPTPRDVAESVVFLLVSDHITGEILYVDSGRHLLG